MLVCDECKAKVNVCSCNLVGDFRTEVPLSIAISEHDCLYFDYHCKSLEQYFHCLYLNYACNSLKQRVGVILGQCYQDLIRKTIHFLITNGCQDDKRLCIDTIAML
jgi:hypothetical protein